MIRTRSLFLAVCFAAPALSPVGPAARAWAQSAAQRDAAEQLQRGLAQDRVSDAARDLRAAGSAEAPVSVEDTSRGALPPERRDLIALPQGSASDSATAPAEPPSTGTVSR